MLKFTQQQIHGPVLVNRQKLINDIENHLQEYCPEIVSAYPRGYLWSILNESIKIAFSFRIDDVHSMRLFARLRWDIAPGFYKQPDIARVLAQTERSAEERFDQLTQPAFDAAWDEAQAFDGPHEWRGEIREVDESGQAPEQGS